MKYPQNAHFTVCQFFYLALHIAIKLYMHKIEYNNGEENLIFQFLEQIKQLWYALPV